MPETQAAEIAWQRSLLGHPEKTAMVMLARHEGGDWEIIEVHSFVTPDGHRWDAVSGWTGPYPYKPAEIAANQAKAGLVWRQCDGPGCPERFATTGRKRFCTDYCRVKYARREARRRRERGTDA